MGFDEGNTKIASYGYLIGGACQACLALGGREFTSRLMKKASIDNSHGVVKAGELYLLGALVTPMESVSTHIQPDPTRTRKLLMHRKEINKMIGLVEQKGYTLMPLKIIRNSRGKLKLIFGLAKGKKNYDKRETEKEKDWKREQEQMFKRNRV